MFWNLWAFCHHLTLLTEWSVGRSFEKNAAAWNPTVARDQNRKWWESTPSLAAAAGEYIYSNHLCPLIVLYAWELFFCYHFKRNSAARKAVRKTEKTKKNCCQETYSDPKKCNSTWPALPHSTCWRCERGMCVWRRRQWRLPRWLDLWSLAAEKSPPPSSASTVAEWSVALSWVRVPAPGGEPRFYCCAPFQLLLLDFGTFWGLGPVVKWNQAMWVVSRNVKRSIGGNLGEHI